MCHLEQPESTVSTIEALRSQLADAALDYVWHRQTTDELLGKARRWEVVNPELLDAKQELTYNAEMKMFSLAAKIEAMK